MRAVAIAIFLISAVASILLAGDYEIGGLAIVKYNHLVDSTGTFSLGAARINATADITDDIRAYIQAEFAREPEILDLYVDYKLDPRLSLRLGQFKLPFGYETQLGKYDLLAVNRSLIFNYLWNNGLLRAYTRDIGLMASGKFRGIKYAFGLVNGSGYNWSKEDRGVISWGTDRDNCKDFVGGIGLDLGFFGTIGYSFYQGKWHNDEGSDPERKAHCFHLFLDTGKMIVQYEHVGSKGRLGDNLFDEDSSWKSVDYGGWYLLLTYRIKRIFEVLYKVDSIDPDNHNSSDKVRDTYLGCNLRIHPDARFRTVFVERKKAGEPVQSQWIFQIATKW